MAPTGFDGARDGLASEQRDWDELAAVDPIWAVLTPRSRDAELAVEEFLRSGERIAAHLLADGRRYGLPARRERALDFGCGPGRVTRALAQWFDDSLGVDVSPLMVAEARRLNADVRGCRFEAISDPELRQLPDGAFDLVHSRHVLEHAPRDFVLGAHLPALARVLAPGGLLVVGIPISLRRRNRLGLRRAAYRALRGMGAPPALLQRRLGLNPMRMTAVPADRVREALERSGARMLEMRTAVGSTGVVKATYLATK